MNKHGFSANDPAETIFGRRGFCLFLTVCLVGEIALAEEAKDADRPRIVAHRGLLRHAPENTLANFRACLELRLGFELDVRRSQDGKLVCIHDGTVNRTTNGRGNVADFTLAELKQLDAGSWFSQEFAGERIPTIDEVFALLAKYPQADVLIAVDIKAADERVEKDLVALANRHKVLPRLLFIGRTIRDEQVRRRLQAASPQAQVAALANQTENWQAAVADKTANWVYGRFLPTREQLQAARAAGKRVFLSGPPLNARNPAAWQHARSIGADGLLTDYPLEVRARWRADDSE